MKIGFIFLTVNDVKNVDVWQHWFSNATSEYQIFIHSKHKYNDYPTHSIFKDKLIANYTETEWGFLAKAQMLLWQEAYNNGCDYVVLLSDKCIPLNHYEFLHFYLQTNTGKSFLGHTTPWWNKARYKRCTYKVMASHQWIIIHRTHLKILISSHKIYNDLRKFCAHPDDECYPATVFEHFDMLNDNYTINKLTTFADWARNVRHRHPHTFATLTDYDYSLLQEKAQVYFFARKFEELSIINKNKILQLFDERLFNSNDSR